MRLACRLCERQTWGREADFQQAKDRLHAPREDKPPGGLQQPALHESGEGHDTEASKYCHFGIVVIVTCSSYQCLQCPFDFQDRFGQARPTQSDWIGKERWEQSAQTLPGSHWWENPLCVHPLLIEVTLKQTNKQILTDIKLQLKENSWCDTYL